MTFEGWVYLFSDNTKIALKSTELRAKPQQAVSTEVLIVFGLWQSKKEFISALYMSSIYEKRRQIRA